METAPLHSRIEQMLTEARVILPGAQALLGFQLAIVLTDTFEKLPILSRLLHAAALMVCGALGCAADHPCGAPPDRLGRRRRRGGFTDRRTDRNPCSSTACDGNGSGYLRRAIARVRFNGSSGSNCAPRAAAPHRPLVWMALCRAISTPQQISEQGRMDLQQPVGD